jgi:poly(hydroxyalkanoate) depolymerase family esterase
MLHGCSQSASDFAIGTGMNRLADELGFAVLYPQQSRKANPARCWNWHKRENQSRGSGEPAMIAALTRHVITLVRANVSRVYIAGLSAGGSAAAIIAAAYPDLFVAAGVHSGVAHGQIRSLAMAIAAMRGENRPSHAGKGNLPCR